SRPSPATWLHERSSSKTGSADVHVCCMPDRVSVRNRRARRFHGRRLRRRGRGRYDDREEPMRRKSTFGMLLLALVLPACEESSTGPATADAIEEAALAAIADSGGLLEDTGPRGGPG